MVKDPPANAGDMGLIPVPERSHMLRGNKQVCATTTEPWAPQNLRSETRESHSEKPVPCN